MSRSAKMRAVYDEFVEAMREQGCHVRPLGRGRGGGYFILLPNGKPTVLHNSPSDRRFAKNLRADIERAGLTFPEIGKKLL